MTLYDRDGFVLSWFTSYLKSSAMPSLSAFPSQHRVPSTFCTECHKDRSSVSTQQ